MCSAIIVWNEAGTVGYSFIRGVCLVSDLPGARAQLAGDWTRMRDAEPVVIDPAIEAEIVEAEPVADEDLDGFELVAAVKAWPMGWDHV